MRESTTGPGQEGTPDRENQEDERKKEQELEQEFIDTGRVT